MLYSAKQIKELKASKSDEPLGKLMLKLRTGCYEHMTGELTYFCKIAQSWQHIAGREPSLTLPPERMMTSGE